jgi:hypothetical protein
MYPKKSVQNRLKAQIKRKFEVLLSPRLLHQNKLLLGAYIA